MAVSWPCRLLPDFVLLRRRDSTDVIGTGLVPAHRAGRLLYDVPELTVRSWRQRFGDRAGLLTACLTAVATSVAQEADLNNGLTGTDRHQPLPRNPAPTRDDPAPERA